MDGGEGSHGTSDTEYSGTERSPQLRSTSQQNPTSDRYRHPRRGYAASSDARPEVIVDAGRVSVDAACPLRGCLYLSESRVFISIMEVAGYVETYVLAGGIFLPEYSVS